MASSVASYTELRAKVDSLFATSSGAIGATDEAPLVDRALQEAGAALARAQDGGSKGDLALATSVRPTTSHSPRPPVCQKQAGWGRCADVTLSTRTRWWISVADSNQPTA